MALTRIKAPGWSSNEKLTSSQMTSVDANIENALDKRSGQTDTLQSVVTVGAGGSIRTGVNNGIVVNSSVGIAVNVAGGVNSTQTNGIISSAAGGIVSQAAGGIACAGGSSDWVTYSPARARDIQRTFGREKCDPTKWSWVTTPVLGMQALDATASEIYAEIQVHDGATLATVTVNFRVTNAHGSGLPTTLPKIRVLRYNYGGGSDVLNTSTPDQGPNPATAVDWYNSGNWQQFTYTCNANNVVDRSQYVYLLRVTNENGGAGATSGLLLTQFSAHFTGITDSRPA